MTLSPDLVLIILSFTEMVDIGEGDHRGNYDMYDHGINASVDPGYGQQYYYDGANDGGGAYGEMHNQYDDPYGGGYNNSGGLRKRNV